MRSASRRALHALLATGLCLYTSLSQAQAPEPPPDGNSDLAREWANKGKQRFDGGDYQGAVDAFQEALKHARAPTITRALAQANEKLGKLLEARRLYQSIASAKLPPTAPPPWLAAQKEAKKDLASVATWIPSVKVTVSGAPLSDLHVTFDGAAFNAAKLGEWIQQDPGKHSVTVSAPGRKSAVKQFTLSQGANEEVQIALEAGTASPGKGPSKPGSAQALTPLRIIGFATLGVGGAGLIAGAIAGGVAIAKRDQVKTACGADFALHRCSDTLTGPLDDARSVASVSTAGFVLAGAGAAVGLTLLLLPQKKMPSVGVAIAPGSLFVQGAF